MGYVILIVIAIVLVGAWVPNFLWEENMRERKREFEATLPTHTDGERESTPPVNTTGEA